MNEQLVVKVQDSSPSQGTKIHQIFSDLCGEMRNLYIYRTDETQSKPVVHCFIEFKHAGSVERAHKLHVDGIRVLDMSPSLMQEYGSLVHEAHKVEEKDVFQSNASAAPSPGPSSRPPSSIYSNNNFEMSLPIARSKDCSNAEPLDCYNYQIEGTDTMILDRSRTLSPSPLSSTFPSHQLPSPGRSSSGGSIQGASKPSMSSLLSRVDGIDGKENVLLAPEISQPDIPSFPPTPLSISRRFAPLPAVGSSDQCIPVVSGPSFTLDTRLIMTLCNELISYDLESLDEDPQAIISLLKATASERDKWMMVACHYRRNGNFKAAICVVTMMIQVMSEHKMSEHDIKPAFLMLSSCETELSKRARTCSGENTEASLEHAQKSYTWLQKVYGSDRQEPNSSHTTDDLAPELPINAIAPSTPSSDHTKMSVDASVTPIPTSPSRLKTLERELSALRERESTLTNQLHNARAAKHKLQREVDSERNVRRKLEKKLDIVDGELDMTRKMESFALDQVKREIESRRRAEERAENERNKRKEIEACLKGQGTRPLFEDLAEMFQRAAKGEGIILPNMACGSSPETGRGDSASR